jgi:hypothetical protein
MEWGKTFLWLIRGAGTGLALFFLLAAAAYVLVPLESDPAQRIVQVDAG